MEKLKNLPPLTEVIDEKDSPAKKFRQLIKILLTVYGHRYDFKFETVDREDTGFEGIINENYPDVDLECPIIFHIVWSKGVINKEPIASEIKRSFAQALESRILFKSYIIVTPHDLSDLETIWLKGFQRDHKIRTGYIGHKKILELMDFFPALRKYYYGVGWEGNEQFGITSTKYFNSITNEVRYLEFIGIPTWQYKRNELLKKTQLNEVYIPLLFLGDLRSTAFLSLHELINLSHRTVILGDPGAGKSTLAKYLALVYAKEASHNSGLEIEKKTPFFISIRDYARVKRSKASFDFADYLKYNAENNYEMKGIDKDFFIALLALGKAVVLFDGLDELMSKENQLEIVKEINQFAYFYPDSPVWITSRVLGYGDEVKFDRDKFNHYYIAPVTEEQAYEFIERWYQVQIPAKGDERNYRIDSLKKAIKENEGVRRLQKNPLLLTMMVLIHQFEGTLPDDRGRLYEKCIELLLKTWQDQKYISQGEVNPLDKIGIRYDDQLRLLAAAAFYVQEKNADAPSDFARGVIGEKELEEVLFKIRYDPRRIREDKAREDIKTFLAYIRDRVGLFVDAGKIENTDENVLSFFHISFLEYLCAYQIAQDKSKSQKEHIDTLLGYLGKPAWEEIVLLALYIFSKSPNGDTFLDSFIDGVFKPLESKLAPHKWYLLGRAVRDNINLTFDDIYKIIKGLLELWLNDNANEIPRTIIKEIVDFSPDGREFLEKILKENVASHTAPKAFASLHFFIQFFLVNNEIIDAVENNSDKSNLLPYLPLFRGNKVLSRFVEQNLEIYQWDVYYNSVKDNTGENLDRIINYKINERELKGCIISSWSKIFNVIQGRRHFLENNPYTTTSRLRLETIDFDFGYAGLKSPLNLFRLFMETQEGNLDTPGNITIQLIVEDIFRFLDKATFAGLNWVYITAWINGIMERNLSDLAKKLILRYRLSPEELNQIKEIRQNFSSAFGKYLSYDLSKYISEGFSEELIRFLTYASPQDFSRYLSRDFSLYLSQDYKRNSTASLSKRFSRFLEREFGLELSRNFIRYFFGYFTPDICRDYVQDCWQKFNPKFRGMITDSYTELYNKSIDRAHIGQLESIELYECFSKWFRENNQEFIDYFYNYLFEYLFFSKIKILFLESTIPQNPPVAGKKSSTDRITLRMKEPFMFPFTFDFIFTGAFNHYIIKVLADLNNKFYKNIKPTEEIIKDTVENFCRNHSFLSYIISEIWYIYAKELKEKSQPGHSLNNLRLAALLTNAARVSMVTDAPCSGSEWDNILHEAETSEDPFVKVALTLYKISIFEDSRENALRLYEHMRHFKKEYPDYYKLIGFSS